MYRLLNILLLMLTFTCFAQNTDNRIVLESRFRNLIDTLSISQGGQPSIVLFVHSACGKNNCATVRMQQKLCQDSLNMRKNNRIKLYVINPHEFQTNDIVGFDSFSPKNATLAFDINRDHRKSFCSDISTTPYIVLFDGKGAKMTQTDGTYEDLYHLVTSFIAPLK